MNYKISFNRIIFFSLNVLLFIYFIYLFLGGKTNSLGSDWAKLPALLSLIAFGFNMVYILLNKINFFDFRAIYLILAYMFMYGRIWVAALGMEDATSWGLQYKYEYNTLFKTSIFCLCCTQATFIGLFLRKENKSKIKTDINRRSSFDKENKSEVNKCSIQLVNCAVAILAIAIPCRLYTDLTAIIAARSTGFYISIQSQVGLIDDFAFFLIPGLLFLMEGKPRRRLIILVTIMIYFIVVMALTGDRRYYVSALLSFGMYFVQKVWKKKKINLFKICVYLFVALLFLNFLQIVRSARNGNIGSLGTFISNYGYRLFDFSSFFIDVFGEFGISFYSVASIVEHVPSNLLEYQFGGSFIKSLVTVIPFGGYAEFLYGAEPSAIINDFTGLPVGGTIYGDMFANFGYSSIFFVVFFNYLLGRWFVFLDGKKTQFYTVLYYTSVYVLINCVRASFYELVRPLVWGLLISYLFYKLFGKANSNFLNRSAYYKKETNAK